MLLHMQAEPDSAGRTRSSRFLIDWSVAEQAYGLIRSRLSKPTTNYVPVVTSATVTVNGLTNVEVAVTSTVFEVSGTCSVPSITTSTMSNLCRSQVLSISVSLVPVESGWQSNALWILSGEGP